MDILEQACQMGVFGVLSTAKPPLNLHRVLANFSMMYSVLWFAAIGLKTARREFHLRSLGFLGHLVLGNMTGPQKHTKQTPNLKDYDWKTRVLYPVPVMANLKIKR